MIFNLKNHISKPISNKLPISADYKHYNDMSSMAIASSDIIVGQVTKIEKKIINVSAEKDKETNPQNFEYLVSIVYISDVLKGGTNIGQTIQVKQLITNDSNLYLKVDEKAVLFLEKYDSIDIPYSLIEQNYSYADIINSRTSIDNKNSIFANNVDVQIFIKQIKDCITIG
jgi:hypothetical protein